MTEIRAHAAAAEEAALAKVQSEVEAATAAVAAEASETAAVAKALQLEREARLGMELRAAQQMQAAVEKHEQAIAEAASLRTQMATAEANRESLVQAHREQIASQYETLLLQAQNDAADEVAKAVQQ